MASETPGKPVTACPWNVEAESVDDLDPARLPAVEELEAWLDEKTPETAKDAWVEASSSSETWATAEGRVQRRARGRVWAVFTPSEGLGMGGKPLFLAARSWREMSRLEPARAWLERSLESAGEHPWPDDAKLVFSPETSAFLAHLLATVAHRPGIEPGNPVGPGWVLTARPGDEPACLFGSVVDDAGFTGESRILADGNHVVDDWGGPGSLKRASFRDVPEPSAVSLRLKPPRIDAPHRSVWITRIDLHPADAGWLAELHGRRYPDGAALCPKWCRLRPQELLETCLGGLGEPFASHLGTTTPALVFDAFLFRAD